jgi:hypothetical protein
MNHKYNLLQNIYGIEQISLFQQILTSKLKKNKYSL